MAKSIKLNSGASMPTFALGTWKADQKVVGDVIKSAIDLGVRHFDTAFSYENEAEIGQALSAVINEGKVKREDLFLSGKLWNTFHNPKSVKKALQKTMDDLQVKYLDLFLIHWPVSTLEKGWEIYPADADGKQILSDFDYIDTWKAMEELVKEGLVKAIGLSNFNSKQIQRVIDNGSIVPACNQVEIHPYLHNKKLVEFCEGKGIAVVAYSPFGSPDRTWIQPEEPRVLNNEVIKEIGKRNNKSIAQVVLRWLVQRGLGVIPKTVHAERIKENMDIFDWSLSDGDMEIMFSLNTGYRACPVPLWGHSQYHPFNNVEF